MGTIEYGVGFVAKGFTPATYVAEQMRLQQEANELLLGAYKRNGGTFKNGHNGHMGYNKGHKFAGRMRTADKPYQTEVMRSNGAGGFRSPRPSVHGSGPSTRA